MKKRLISILLVMMMLVTLIPMGAYAVIGDTQIVKQPEDAYVYPGETATFSIVASNPNATSDLIYLWFDASNIDLGSISLSNISGILPAIQAAKIGEGMYLAIPKVTEAMN